MAFLLSLCFVAAVLVCGGYAQQGIGSGCERTFSGGDRFNLTALARPDFYSMGTNPRLVLNICGNVHPRPTECAGLEDAAAFAIVNGRCMMLGKLDDQIWYRHVDPNDDVSVIYPSGEACGGRRRSLRIAFRCAIGGHENGPTLAIQNDACSTTVWWDSPSACATKVSIVQLCLNDVRTFCPASNVDAALESRCLRRNLDKLSSSCGSSLPTELLECVPDAATMCGALAGPDALICLGENQARLWKKCRSKLKTYLGVDWQQFVQGVENEDEQGVDDNDESGDEETATDDSEDSNDELIGALSIVFGSLFGLLAVIYGVRYARKKKRHQAGGPSRRSAAKYKPVHEADIPEGIALEDVEESMVVEGIPFDQRGAAARSAARDEL